MFDVCLFNTGSLGFFSDEGNQNRCPGDSFIVNSILSASITMRQRLLNSNCQVNIMAALKVYI